MSTCNELDDIVRQKIKKLTDFSSFNKLELLAEQGEINRSYCLNLGTKQYLVKYFASTGHKYIDRNIQFRTQQQAAGYNLAPTPRYISPQQDIWIEDWIKQKSIKLNRKEQIQHIVETLSKLHAIKIDCPPLPLIQDWQAYLQSMPKEQAASFNKEIRDLTPIWEAYSLQHHACCHNDLSTDNISSDGSNICFDWEYAAKNNRFYDIASSILINKYNKTEQKLLIQYYAKCSEFSVEEVQYQVSALLPIAKLTNKLWYAAVLG